MNILFCGYTESPLIDFLRESGENVYVTDTKISSDLIEENNIEFIISYGYRHIIKKDVLNLLPNKVINLHISYLPWNRGADPNFWSILEDTPKGVSIHLIDEGLDTGGVLIQERVDLSMQETLRTSYAKLQEKIQTLFKENWQKIKEGTLTPTMQVGEGTYHRSRDKIVYISAMDENWLDVSLEELIENVRKIDEDQ